MTALAQQLTDATAEIFTRLGLDVKGAFVRRSDRPDLSDFQCNGALVAAKSAGRKPVELATLIAEAWALNHVTAPPSVLPPGFLNFRILDIALSARVEEILTDPKAGATSVLRKRRVLVDYGGPNVAKPMHVGHLRASIIGESLKRVFRFRGDTVWGDAHFGDWGYQMGLLIAAFEDRTGALHPDELALELAKLELENLDVMYPVAAARAKIDEDFQDRARKATLALQKRDPVHTQIWRRFHDLSMAALKREFAALDIHFDLWNGESDADPFIAPMIEELRLRHLLEDSQGAQIVRTHRAGDKHELPPLLVISSEGSSLYGTTDLATIVQRKRSVDPDLCLYVVDQRQADHFLQVFRVSESAGWVQQGQLEHVGFGTMNGTDGKPFKTRAGGVLKLADLIGMTREKARDRLREADIGSDLSTEEFEDVANKVAVSALKVADLINFRGTSYVFDLDKFTSFEGKTGPYLLYAAVRIQSLLERATKEGIAPGPVKITEPAERRLALTLDAFEEAVTSTYEKRAPHFLTEHAFSLAQGFSVFYENCPILKEPRSEIRGSRVTVAAAVLKQLKTVLDLLGLEAPHRM